MTNEKAIRVLKSKMDGSVDSSYEWIEAITLAIDVLNRQENLEKQNEFLVDKFEDFNELKTRVKILESQMSELVKQTSDEKKDIVDIPKMCEECHSQSYDNGFDAGYELGKEDGRSAGVLTAIRTFLEYLETERKDKTTRKPISRALYYTWRYYDSIEKERGSIE